MMTREELRDALEKEYDDFDTVEELDDYVDNRLVEIQYYNNVMPKIYCHTHKEGCCKHAFYIPCVCHVSYFCPIHGATHVGTHD